MDAVKKERFLYGAIILLTLMGVVQLCTKNSGSDKTIYFSNKNKEEMIQYIDSLNQSNKRLEENLIYLSGQIKDMHDDLIKIKNQNAALTNSLNSVQSQLESDKRRR